ncbi:MAG: hypothetical protein JNN07_00750 [Verrucomicrobiales bacterium]|nr:hypothetical protein [Verrucomicrobiales bacterium]
MKLETVGAVAIRAIGVNLLILGSAWLVALLPDIIAYARESPSTALSGGDGSIEQIYRFFTTRTFAASACIAPTVVITCGALLIVFSRRVGSLLVRGLGIEGSSPCT